MNNSVVEHIFCNEGLYFNGKLDRKNWSKHKNKICNMYSKWHWIYNAESELMQNHVELNKLVIDRAKYKSIVIDQTNEMYILITIERIYPVYEHILVFPAITYNPYRPDLPENCSQLCSVINFFLLVCSPTLLNNVLIPLLNKTYPMRTFSLVNFRNCFLLFCIHMQTQIYTY